MNIKQQIEKRPRLRRAIKIITTTLVIFFAALGVVFSGVLIGSCANQKARQVVAHNEKPIQEAISTGEIYVFGTSSLVSQANYEYMYYLNERFWRTPTQGDTFAFNVWERPMAQYVPWSYVNTYDYLNFDTTQAFYFNAVQFQFQYSFSFGYDNSFLGKMYQVRVYNTETNTASQWIFEFTIVTPQSNAPQSVTGQITNITSLQVSNRDYCIRVDQSYNPNLYAYLSHELGGADIQVDYYNLGTQIGYSEGYQDGYEAGSTGMTSNPFNLISNAFNSIANILNIQVLPNLSLGTLIFAPLVVVILITIIKLIKG